MNETGYSFKDLSTKKKLEYIWDYYKIPIILGIIFIYAIISFVHGRLTAKDTVFRLVMVDSNVTAFIEESFLDGFAETLPDFDPDKEEMKLDANYDLSESGFGVYTIEQKLLAEYNVGSIDGTIAPKEEITELAESQAFADLKEALPEDLMEMINARDLEILYNKYEDPATGEIHEYPFVVNISSSPCISSGFKEATGDTYSYYDKDCYYAICPNAENLENSIAFLKFLLEC
ncbi:MAG: hypothetical protein J5842_03575 [Lachnospiraceae bacterium]|nr:hypothetical protein [Lachnospiraceae bacterium]